MRSTARCQLYASLVLLVCIAITIPIGKSQAAIIGTGCVGGTVCTMQELINGGTLQVDDKLFNNFRGYTSTATGGAETLNPNLILVTDYRVFGGFGISPDELGLVFFEFGAATAQGTFLVGGQTQTTSWVYTVTTLGSPIIDNTLLMSGGGFADVPAGASVVINETASTLVPGGQPRVVADKSVFQDASGLQIQDHRNFAAVNSLDVLTQMNLNGGPDPTDLTINTQVLFLVETFSQVPVPAPGSLALLGIGLLAIVPLARRRSTRYPG